MMKKLKQLLKSDKSEKQSTPTSQQQPTTTTSATHAHAHAQASQQSSSEGVARGVLLTTNYGDITIALYADETPKVTSPPSIQPSTNNTSQTCKNFATLADTHKYDNVIFHRIIPGFVGLFGAFPTHFR